VIRSHTRPGGRSARVRAAVHRAVEDLRAEGPVGSGRDGGSACIADRHAQLAAILERERSRGGHPPDVERAADALLGPLYYRAIFTGHPAEPSWARELVSALLR
jgi:hypothetical protein